MCARMNDVFALPVSLERVQLHGQVIMTLFHHAPPANSLSGEDRLTEQTLRAELEMVAEVARRDGLYGRMEARAEHKLVPSWVRKLD